MAANHIDFELSAAEIDAILTYTPSKEPQETQDFFGRRQLRISMGQDPALHAWKFTPPQPHAFKWPTDEECLLWAEAGKRKAKKQLSLLGILPGETPQMNKKASPLARDACGCRYAERRQRRGHCWGGAFQFGVSSACVSPQPISALLSFCLSASRARVWSTRRARTARPKQKMDCMW